MNLSDHMRENYLVELADHMAGLAASIAEANFRGSTDLADMHFESLRLVARQYADTRKAMNVRNKAKPLTIEHAESVDG
jgi:hypothetical protein